jgi:hypothetical protein
MFEIKNNAKNKRGPTITLTRGDYACFTILMHRKNGDLYELQEGDILYFTVKKNTKTKQIIFQKVFQYGDEPAVEIENEDTKDEPYGTYSYDCSLVRPGTRPDTFIGPADFVIAPEVTF